MVSINDPFINECFLKYGSGYSQFVILKRTHWYLLHFQVPKDQGLSVDGLSTVIRLMAVGALRWMKLWWRALVVMVVLLDDRLAVWCCCGWWSGSGGTGYELTCVLSCGWTEGRRMTLGTSWETIWSGEYGLLLTYDASINTNFLKRKKVLAEPILFLRTL